MILKIFLLLKSKFEKSEPRYLLNRLYFDDFCIFIQAVNESCLRKLSNELNEIKINKNDLDINFEEIEKEAINIMAEEFEKKL